MPIMHQLHIVEAQYCLQSRMLVVSLVICHVMGRRLLTSQAEAAVRMYMYMTKQQKA